jgi:hypothetical protein
MRSAAKNVVGEEHQQRRQGTYIKCGTQLAMIAKNVSIVSFPGSKTKEAASIRKQLLFFFVVFVTSIQSTM